MADLIKCPSCGESNLANQEFCQYCKTRLQPLTGELKDASTPIKPGQAPTKKNTAELEPILPQWLRDARDSARKGAPLPAQPPEGYTAASPAEDLLAGLHSQSGQSEEDDTPDWLASITGATPKSKKNRTESSEVRWVELGDKDDFAQDESTKEADSPSWLKGAAADEPKAEEKDELSDWFREASNLQEPSQPVQSSSLTSTDLNSPSDDAPDWLNQMALENEPRDDVKPFAASSDLFSDAPEISINSPDWLHGLEANAQSADSALFPETGIGESEAVESPIQEALPDWMKEMPASEEPKQDTTPKWLRGESSRSSDEEELPTWLSKDTSPLRPLPEQEPFAQDDSSLEDVPNWVKTSAPQSPVSSQPEEIINEPASPSDASEWSVAFEAEAEPAPAIEQGMSPDMPPAFTADAQAGGSMDDLFTDMPDWLSSAMESSSPSSASASIMTTDAISPGDLPSWVQAMRPLETGISQPASFSTPSDQTLESRGALAGLQGVLPAVPGFTPTSKPKAYSIKLHASEEQQAHAELLEQILAAETAPVPIESFSTLRTSRSLRWFLAFILFFVLSGVLFIRTSIFSMPAGVPHEIGSAIQISQSIPEGAPVLVAFDYEPARAGEMEAAAAPMLDQMILLRHPRLTFIATNKTGALLAERLLSGPLGGHNYQSGIQYLNLGYLPGGQLGIRAFAQNPRVTSPFDMSLDPAWTSAPLSDVASLPQFAMLILITDNADAARVWIEQTESVRGNIPFVVISSAQAAPMIQPYYESGQLNGLVPGLYGGAIFEQYNAGRPGTARAYWDAYSLGMLLAMALVLGGGLWNLALGLQDRASARETN